MATPVRTVDVHTHVYPPSYIKLLKGRDTLPYIRDAAGAEPNSPMRLMILPGEDDPARPAAARGRPIGPEYFDIKEKIAFMDLHDISVSVISLANPWLDFLDLTEAGPAARETNREIDRMCSCYPGRLFAFGVLPLSGSIQDIHGAIDDIKELEHMRGVVMGTGGLGQGLDDPELIGIFEHLQDIELPIFLHPHYGLPKEVMGPRAADYGHVLPLALGFPLETTIAVTRMILAGMFDKVRELKLLIAHSGGTLPFLEGRIQSCIEHDNHFTKGNENAATRRTIADILAKNIYLDAVIYSAIGLRAAIQAVGEGSVMFGTDHPFFPPLEKDGVRWKSVDTNLDAIVKECGQTSTVTAKIIGGNAIEVLRLQISRGPPDS